MTKEEKRDKLIAMQELNIPANKHNAFIRWANKWGRFNIHGDWKWYEYSPLEACQKSTKTMNEMWVEYQTYESRIKLDGG